MNPMSEFQHFHHSKDEEIEKHFHHFKKAYLKNYKNHEENERRKHIFKHNVRCGNTFITYLFSYADYLWYVTYVTGLKFVLFIVIATYMQSKIIE